MYSICARPKAGRKELRSKATGTSTQEPCWRADNVVALRMNVLQLATCMYPARSATSFSQQHATWARSQNSISCFRSGGTRNASSQQDRLAGAAVVAVSHVSCHVVTHCAIRVIAMQPWALVSPASRGIGLELSRRLLQTTNVPVVATARRNLDQARENILSGLRDVKEDRLHVVKLDVLGED